MAIDNTQIRKPTEEEKKQLAESALDCFDDVKEAMAFVNDSMIAVCDDFCCDSVGYRGKMMMVIWPGGPNCSQVLCWDRDGKMYEEKQD